MSAVAVPKARIDALTGLRFFAALFVYLSHHPQPTYLPDWLATFFNAGYSGVTIFFVLSGFVIGLNYFASLARPTRKNILQYGVARFARIYPLYLIVLLYVWWDKGAPLIGDAIVHFLALQAWSPELRLAYAFNGPGWSIGVEFFMYACFPLIALALAPLAQNKKALWWLTLLVILTMVGLAVGFQLTGHGALPSENPDSAHRWLYRTPVTRLGDFVLGVVAALLFMNRSISSERSKRAWAIVSYTALVGIILLMLWPDNLYSVFSWDAFCAISSFFLILGLALVPQTFLSRVLGSRVLVILGEASFALYLIHAPLMGIAGIDYYTKLDPLIAVPLWADFGAICIALSIGLHLYIEAPLRRFITKLAVEPPRTSNLRGWFTQWRWNPSVHRWGLIVFLLVNISVSRWLREQAPFLNTREQGSGELQAQFVNGIRLVEYGLERTAQIQGGDTFRLYLKWSCNGGTTEPYDRQIELRDIQDRAWAQGKEDYQDSSSPCRKQSWLPSDQIIDSVIFSLPVTMPAGEYHIVLSLSDRANRERVVAYTDSGKALGDQLQIISLAIAKNKTSFNASELFIENPFFVDMQEIRFLGYTPLPNQIELGNELDIGLYWRARGKPRGDYMVTVQLRDALGSTLVEQSARPAEDTYPTTGWSEGEVLLDWHRLVIPQRILPGEYQLVTVLRDAEHGQTIGEAKFFTISLAQ